MEDYQYKAFISYSHKDRKWTRWLHRRLETYPIPKNIIGNVTPAGTIPRRLKPIFRDREELSASNNLGEKIEAALASSKNLIIICSPAAAKSKWVNQEILTFKQNNRDAQLFSVIVEGEPYASTMPGREDEECFPPALRFEVNSDGTLSDTPAEPLAADLRPHADGKRLGFLKLISGMIGVGLDDVVQRDMKRSRKRVTAITTGSLATVLAMGTLTGFALDARQKAEVAQAEAESRRQDAEGQIEFMLTDLKEKLEGVGRLDALQAVGERAASYYDQYPISDHDDDALGRRARVYHYLGEIQNKLRNLDEVEKYFQSAYDATQTLLDRSPDDPKRIFNHAQSAYWLGIIPYSQKQYGKAESAFGQYLVLANRLKDVSPNDLRSQTEVVYASSNLGIVNSYLGNYEGAIQIYLNVIPVLQSIVQNNPDKLQYQEDLENVYGWLANASRKLGRYETALNYRTKQRELSEVLVKLNPDHRKYEYNFLTNTVAIIRLNRLMNGCAEKQVKLVEDTGIQVKSLSDLDNENSEWALLVLRIKIEQLFQSYCINELEKIDIIKSDLESLKKDHPSFSETLKENILSVENQIETDRYSSTNIIPNH